ncbi:hypothetical protein BJ165DRAFT_1529733 [Panaeolus papilionaceus]|nr:hypothetical protein BJ165DRAFT_1529733 [Panaeolus papilionaceus]
MSTKHIDIDDGHPFIFSSGTWDQQLSADAFKTKTKGFMKIVRFVSTSRLTGIRQHTNIDNGPPVTYAPASPPFYATVPYYPSPSLSMGEHVLSMMNMVDEDLIWLDYFIIQSVDGGTPQILLSDGALIPQNSTNTAPNSTPPALPTTTLISTITATLKISVSQLSLTPNSTLSQTAKMRPTFKATLTSSTEEGLGPTSLDQNASGCPAPTTINFHNTSASASNTTIDKRAIAGTVGGILALMLLIGRLVLYAHKRRQKHQMMEAILNPYIPSDLNLPSPKKLRVDESFEPPFEAKNNSSTSLTTTINDRGAQPSQACSGSESI